MVDGTIVAFNGCKWAYKSITKVTYQYKPNYDCQLGSHCRYFEAYYGNLPEGNHFIFLRNYGLAQISTYNQFVNAKLVDFYLPFHFDLW